MTEPFAPSIPSGLPLRFASDAVRTRALRFERLKPSGCPSSPLRFAEGYSADGGSANGSGGGTGVESGPGNAPQRTCFYYCNDVIDIVTLQQPLP